MLDDAPLVLLTELMLEDVAVRLFVSDVAAFVEWGTLLVIVEET